MTTFTKFLRDEDGAVTIDWVALTAGILLLGIFVVYGIFETGVADLAESINTNLAGAVTAVAPTADETPDVTTFSAGGATE